MLEKPKEFAQLSVSDEKLIQFYDYAQQELMATGRYEDAEAVLFVLSLIAPDRPHIWISLGVARAKTEEIELAYLAFDYAILLDPTLIEPYYYAGFLAYTLQDKKRAYDYLRHLEEMKLSKNMQNATRRMLEEVSHG